MGDSERLGRAGQERPWEPFGVEVRRDRERAIVAPHGELDLATVDVLRREIDALVDRGFGRLVLDLRRLDFMDSSGLRLMLQQSQRRDATVSLIDGTPPVSTLFDLTATRPLFRFEERP